MILHTYSIQSNLREYWCQRCSTPESGSQIILRHKIVQYKQTFQLFWNCHIDLQTFSIVTAASSCPNSPKGSYQVYRPKLRFLPNHNSIMKTVSLFLINLFIWQQKDFTWSIDYRYLIALQTVLLMTSVVMMFVVVVEPAELKSGPNPLYSKFF